MKQAFQHTNNDILSSLPLLEESERTSAGVRIPTYGARGLPLQVSVPPSGNRSILTVIGAGPGDPELITLKAIKALQTAQVVLYDALVNEELLEHAPNAEKIFVGKRKGCYTYQQEQINELIVSRAKSHGHVVRLKGGDSFVFGRGAEEMEYAAQQWYRCCRCTWNLFLSVGSCFAAHSRNQKRCGREFLGHHRNDEGA